MSRLGAAFHLHQVVVLTGRTTYCIFICCLIQGTSYVVLRERSRGLLFFLVLQTVCLVYLCAACHPSPAGNTSLFAVLWCSEDVCCYSYLIANDREFILLMRQKRVVIFLASEGRRDIPFRHMGKEQSSRCRTGAWGLLALSALLLETVVSRLYQFAG